MKDERQKTKENTLIPVMVVSHFLCKWNKREGARRATDLLFPKRQNHSSVGFKGMNFYQRKQLN
jgi:hypothetical protein